MIQCLIVDDEPIAIRVLETHLAKMPGVQITATCTNAFGALRTLRSETVDLVFLDIEMPELTGIDLVKSLERPPRFVFTTAHRDYALQGYELDAVDYLLKPIGFPRLLRAVEKYRRLRRAAETDAGAEDANPDAHTLNVRVGHRTVRVDLPAIRYIESLSDYVKIHTTETTHTSKLRLSDLGEQLAPHGFLRIHRSFLVAVRHVDAFTAKEVQVSDQVLPVSRTYREQVMARLRSDVA